MTERAIPFVKMSGSGNDFILIDNRTNLVDPEQAAPFVRAVCRRGMSVGADGLILLAADPQGEVDFGWRFFNSDGSESEMCGNGGRCAVRYAMDLGLAGRETAFRTRAGVIRGQVLDNREVRVQLTEPSDYRPQVRIDIHGEAVYLAYLDAGVPHAVLVVPDAEAVDVARVGRLVRQHAAFAPRGANVNFVQVLSASDVIIRTYERGVEGETLACGTGCAAAAITLTLADRVKQPVRLRTRGGEVLTVDFTREGDLAMRPTLQGLVRYLSVGMIHPEAWAE